MPAVKTKSISETKLVMLKITNINGPMLGDLEKVLMKERGALNRLHINNSDIINDAILTAHKVKCRRKK